MSSDNPNDSPKNVYSDAYNVNYADSDGEDSTIGTTDNSTAEADYENSFSSDSDRQETGTTTGTGAMNESSSEKEDSADEGATLGQMKQYCT